MSSATSLSQSFQALKDLRFLTIFLMGFASGLPWALHGTVLTRWLQDSGFSRSEIGYIGIVSVVYAINWIWAPFVDQVRIPWLNARLGRRRDWMVLCQVLLIVAIVALSFADPMNRLGMLVLSALLISVFSATLDITIDSYRITLFSQEEADRKIPFSAAATTAGWWAGYGFIGGALALFLGGETIELHWTAVLRCMSLFYLATILVVIVSPRVTESAYPPDSLSGPGARTQQGALQALSGWLSLHVFRPFYEFFVRCGWQLAVAILLFLFCFRLGEAMLGKMSVIFYNEIGFTDNQIALYSKFIGGITTAVFTVVGGLVNTRFGVMRGMIVGGIAMAASNLLYALMAHLGPLPWLFVITLFIDNFTSAFATVAVISFMSYFASRTYTGTQFALMTSISNFGRTTLAAGSGFMVDFLGGNWPVFFIMTTLMVIPALLLLIWMSRLLRRFEG